MDDCDNISVLSLKLTDPFTVRSQMDSRGPIERALATAEGHRSQNVASANPQSENMDVSPQNLLTNTNRQYHLVSTIAQRLSVPKWMTKEAENFGDT